MPTREAIERAVALLSKGGTNSTYFFSKLADPSWVQPLAERGFFSDPPEPKAVSGGTSFPLWPELSYLERVVGQAPDEVGRILVALPSTDNVRVRAGIARAAASLPLDVAKKLAKKERRWLNEGRWVGIDYPEAAAALASRLAELGGFKEGRPLLWALLRIAIDEQEETWRRRPLPRFERWEYDRVCRNVLPGLADRCGIVVIAFVASLLESALAADEDEKPRDRSEIWRPAIEDHEQNVDMDVRESLISLLRDVAAEWIGNSAERLRDVKSELDRREWTIFQRMALYLLRDKLDLDRDLAVQAVLSRNAFFDAHLVHEYMQLTHATWPVLTASEKKRWFALLDEGPEWPSRDKQAREAEGIADDDYARLVALWRRDRLAVVGDALPDERRSELEALSERFGVAEHPTFLSFSTSWTGPTSPLNEAQMQELDAPDLIQFLREWKPTGEMQSPTPEGLGRILSGRVADIPDAFTAHAEAIAALDPTYVRAVIFGLEQAVKAGGAFDWPGALTLVEAAVEAREVDRTGWRAEASERDWDPGWGWARKSAAALLVQGLGENVVPTDLAERVWAAIEALSWDPEPSPDYERQYGGGNMDPLTLSINTVRGEAMHAAVQYAVWRKRHEQEPFRLEGSPGLKANLEAHLDPEQEPSETVRAVFGSRLHQLHWVDSLWVAETLSDIFPETHSTLRLAAWESYLVYGHLTPSLFRELEPEYRQAVARLPTPEDRRNRAGRSPETSLGHHLATVYWWGLVDLAPDGIMHGFVNRAHAGAVADLASFVGRALGQDATGDISEASDRLMALWEAIVGWSKTRSAADRATILATFGWWYGAGVLDPTWSDEELVRLYNDGINVDPDFSVAARLGRRRVEDFEAAFKIVAAYVSALTDPWHLYGMRDELRAVLGEAVQREALRADAERAIHELGHKGYLEFRDLLSPGEPQATSE